MMPLAELIGPAHALLLDFDGPVCDLFAGYTAATIAGELRAFLASKAVSLPADIQDGSDPLQLIRWVGSSHPELIEGVEDRLIHAERAAARTARPTTRAHDAIIVAAQYKVPVAIVSNNSKSAISGYLNKHGLSRKVSTIVGRVYGHPELMKPDPSSLLNAVVNIGVRPEAAVFLGDATTDIEAARRASMASIGYAKKPGRYSSLEAEGASCVIDDMATLEAALRMR